MDNDKIETTDDEVIVKKYVKIKISSIIILCLLGLLFVFAPDAFFEMLMFFYIFG